MRGQQFPAQAVSLRITGRTRTTSSMTRTVPFSYHLDGKADDSPLTGTVHKSRLPSVKPETSGEIAPQGLHGCRCRQCSGFRPQHSRPQPQGLPARLHGSGFFLGTQPAFGAGQ